MVPQQEEPQNPLSDAEDLLSEDPLRFTVGSSVKAATFERSDLNDCSLVK